MAIGELNSNNTIIGIVPEQFVETWIKKTAAQVIRQGDLLKFDTSGVVPCVGATPDSSTFVGVAIGASDGSQNATGNQYILVAFKCRLRVLLDGGGVTFPGKAVKTSAGSNTVNWVWTTGTTDSYGWAAETIPASAYGIILIDRDLLGSNAIRQAVTS